MSVGYAALQGGSYVPGFNNLDPDFNNPAELVLLSERAVDPDSSIQNIERITIDVTRGRITYHYASRSPTFDLHPDEHIVDFLHKGKLFTLELRQFAGEEDPWTGPGEVVGDDLLTFLTGVEAHQAGYDKEEWFDGGDANDPALD